jgi:hypothetical protein
MCALPRRDTGIGHQRESPPSSLQTWHMCSRAQSAAPGRQILQRTGLNSGRDWNNFRSERHEMRKTRVACGTLSTSFSVSADFPAINTLGWRYVHCWREQTIECSARPSFGDRSQQTAARQDRGGRGCVGRTDVDPAVDLAKGSHDDALRHSEVPKRRWIRCPNLL